METILLMIKLYHTLCKCNLDLISLVLLPISSGRKNNSLWMNIQMVANLNINLGFKYSFGRLILAL